MNLPDTAQRSAALANARQTATELVLRPCLGGVFGAGYGLDAAPFTPAHARRFLGGLADVNSRSAVVAGQDAVRLACATAKPLSAARAPCQPAAQLGHAAMASGSSAAALWPRRPTDRVGGPVQAQADEPVPRGYQGQTGTAQQNADLPAGDRRS